MRHDPLPEVHGADPLLRIDAEVGFVTPEQLARFRSEAEILARMRHPNIVPIYDVGEFEGRPYLVMEFVDGPSLGQFLAGKPQNAKAAARLLELLARTIQNVHDNGVIHRDLKPGNVLLECSEPELELQSATPKITDFGVAKDQANARDLTLTGMMMGTPGSSGSRNAERVSLTKVPMTAPAA